MPDLMVDTSVLVGYTRGDDACRAIIDERNPSRRLVTHVVCQAELLNGAMNSGDLRLLSGFLRQFRLIVPSEADLIGSLALLRGHVLNDGVDWHDCLIAATALRLGLPVATCNIKHFRCFQRLSVISVA